MLATGTKSSLRSWHASGRSVPRMSSKPCWSKATRSIASKRQRRKDKQEWCGGLHSSHWKGPSTSAGRQTPHGAGIQVSVGQAAGGQRRPWATRSGRKEVWEVAGDTTPDRHQTWAVSWQAVDQDAGGDKADDPRSSPCTTNDGDHRTEGEETTGEQLSALPFRLSGGETRFLEQQRAVRTSRPWTTLPGPFLMCPSGVRASGVGEASGLLRTDDVG